MVKVLEHSAATDSPRYRKLYLWAGIMGKTDRYRLTIRDLVTACGERASGVDLDYARAFFPVLGLRWRTGMTREQGMQTIYHSFPEDTAIIACMAGSRRLKLNPGWAPSYLQGLEGVGHGGLTWESHGIRGEWHVLKIKKLLGCTLPRFGKIGLNMELESPSASPTQCVTAPNEDPQVIERVKHLIEQGRGIILSVSSFAKTDLAWAMSVLIAEVAETERDHDMEVYIHCSATKGSPDVHVSEKKAILIRHANPDV